MERRVRGALMLPRSVLWTVLDGFKVADEPSKLNASRVGSGVYTRSGRSTAGS